MSDRLDWREVPGFPGYAMTKTGQIRSPHKVLKPSINPYGYLFVTLHKDNKTHGRRVHRLLLQTFSPQPNDKLCALHKDGNRLNNDLSNLYWGTQKENYADARGHGTANILERHGSAKLTLAKVKVIREKLSAGVSQRPIAREFGVSQNVICLINRGEIWKTD